MTTLRLSLIILPWYLSFFCCVTSSFQRCRPECARVRVRSPMSKYTDFPKGRSLNNYVTPVLKFRENFEGTSTCCNTPPPDQDVKIFFSETLDTAVRTVCIA
jgi:hypothetical protein